MGSAKATTDFRNITVPAKGPALDAINSRAAERDLPLGQAVLSLIEDGLKGAPAVSTTFVNLESVSADDLIDEIVGRLQQVAELEQVAARAERAEARLQQVAAALTGSETAEK